jgi:hypothetical protein
MSVPTGGMGYDCEPTLPSNHTPDIHDPPPAPQVRQALLNQKHRKPHVRVEHLVEVLVRRVLQEHLVARARIVDDDVDPAVERLDRGLHDFPGGIGVDAVGADAGCFGPSSRLVRVDFLDELLGLVCGGDVGDEDVGAAAGELGGNAGANAAGGAGDDCYFVLEGHL